MSQTEPFRVRIEHLAGRVDHQEDEQSLAEIDRTARAYGFEIGRGKKIAKVVEISDDNPFLDPNWRKTNGLDAQEAPGA